MSQTHHQGSRVGHVLTMHFYPFYMFIRLWAKPSCLYSQPRTSQHIGWYSFSIPLRSGGWVGLGGSYIPRYFTHPNTSLIPVLTLAMWSNLVGGPTATLQATGRNPPLIRYLDFWAICIACLFILYASPLILFLHFSLTYLLPYLSYSLRIDPLLFQAGCRKRRLNLALVFMFVLCCNTFLLIGECMLLVC